MPPINKKEACTRFNLEPNIKFVLFGAVNAIADTRKGFRILLESFEHISRSNNHSIEFLIFGTKKEEYISFSGFPVHNLGIIEDDELLASLYSAADVTVVPSICENLSNVIMESMACGTPVVGFDIGGNSDMIEHKINGYLAEPFNPADLANGIIWCLDNNQKNDISHNARKKILENFNIESVKDSYAKLYQELSKSE